MRPLRWVLPQDQVGRYSGRWHHAYDARRLQRVPPIRYGTQEADFASKLEPEIPELGVLELPEGYVVGGDGWVLSRERHLMPDQTWFGRNMEQGSRALPDRTQRVVKVEGVLASVVSRSAISNYGHFVLDSVGRVGLLEAAGIDFSQIDHFYCGSPSVRARRLLERAGIPLEKAIWVKKGIALHPDVLFAPTFPGTRRNYQPWLIEYLRRSLLPPDAPGGQRRLYVQRTVDRRVSNENLLMPILERHGFEIYDPTQHAEPPCDFHAASVVVGPHGAGLTDLVFCRPGTRVLELMSPLHPMPYWYTISEAGGLRYGYLLGAEAEPSGLHRLKWDFSVDVDEFEAALVDTIGDGRAS